MGYSEFDHMVRIDRFKESGKWYDSYAIDMGEYWSKETLIHDALRNAIDARFGVGWVRAWETQGGFIVCLEPYHETAHPVVLKGAGLSKSPTVDMGIADGTAFIVGTSYVSRSIKKWCPYVGQASRTVEFGASSKLVCLTCGENH